MSVVDADAVLCQLEIPVEAVAAAAAQAQGLFCLNAAPAIAVPLEVLRRADLVVVNRYELDALAETPRLVALTLGAEGAVLLEDGEEVARAAPPPVTAVDGTAAGDAFCAASLVSLLEGRDRDEALRRACAAGAIAASRPGAQPSLPTAAELDEILRTMSTVPILLDCDPGHDDAIALLLALASPELELLGVTTVAGNQTLEKTTANAIRLLDAVGRAEIPVAAGADRPLVRERYVAAYVHGETGLDGPDLPPPSRAPDAPARGRLPRRDAERRRAADHARPDRAADEHRAPARAPPGIVERIERIVLMGGAIAEGNVTPAAEFNIWADPEAARRVFESGIDVTMVGLDVTHQALVGEPEAERMRGTGRAGEIVADLLDFYGRFHREQYGWAGSPIHDAVAVAHVARPGLLETKHRRVEVDCSWELSRGRTHVDLWERTGEPRTPRRHGDRRARLRRAL